MLSRQLARVATFTNRLPTSTIGCSLRALSAKKGGGKSSNNNKNQGHKKGGGGQYKSFDNNYNDKNQSHKKGGGGGGGKSVTLVFSDTWEAEEEDQGMKVRANSLDELRTRAVEELYHEEDSACTLEYANSVDDEWRPLKSLDVLKANAFVRIKEVAALQDYDGVDDEYDKYDDYNGYSGSGSDSDDDKRMTKVSPIYQIIEELVTEAQSAGTQSDTKSFVLDKAKSNERLRRVIVGEIGALDHIVACLQMPIWDRPTSEEQHVSEISVEPVDAEDDKDDKRDMAK